MPLTGDAKRDYQRKKMAERRAAAKTAEPSPTNDSSEGKVPAKAAVDPETGWLRKPRRNELGDLVLKEPRKADLNGQHYWRRKPSDDFAECIEFRYQGRWIGGCGEIRKYEGRLLNANADNSPDLGQAIADSPAFKEIQAKMPVTKDRFGK